MGIPIEIAKNLLMAFEPLAKAAQRYHSTGVNSDPAAVARVFDLYSTFQPAVGKDILEIGPGQTLEVLETALKAGAKSCAAIDVLAYIRPEEAEKKQIAYRVYDGKLVPFASSRFDLIWSYTAFEHLRYPETTVAECFRVLRDGGGMVAMIDLGDHASYGHTSPQPLKLFDCLRYPEWLWKAMRWNRSSYVNRLRRSDWLRLFRQAGFIVRKDVSRISEDIAAALPSLPYLHGMSREDAVTHTLTVWLEKPGVKPSF